MACSLAQSLAQSLAHSLGQSLAHSLAHSLGQCHLNKAISQAASLYGRPTAALMVKNMTAISSSAFIARQ